MKIGALLNGVHLFFVFFRDSFPKIEQFNSYYSMRRIKFLVILMLGEVLAGASGAAGVAGLAGSALWAEAFHADLYGDSKKVFGAKVKTPISEVRFSTKEAESFNWGVAFSTKKVLRTFPAFTIKGGNLSAGGLLSHLNNPSLSGGSSPFSSSVMQPGLMTCSLPGWSTFSKGESLFMEIEGTAAHTKADSAHTRAALSCWLEAKSPSPIFSSLLSTSLAEKKLLLQWACCGGIFSYNANDSSSWFSKEIAYADGAHLCAISQLALQYEAGGRGPLLFTGVSGAVYETPFRDFPMNFRIDFKLKGKKTEIFTSAFYNPKEGLITSSQKSLPSCMQFKAGFTRRQLAGIRLSSPLLLKYGVNALYQHNFYSDSEALVNSGIQISSSLTSLSFSSSVKFTPENLTSLSFQIKNLWYLKLINPGLSFNASFSPDKAGAINSKYKASLTISRNGKVNLNGNTAFSFSYKEARLSSAKLNGSLTARLNFPTISFTGKISADIDLYLE